MTSNPTVRKLLKHTYLAMAYAIVVAFGQVAFAGAVCSLFGLAFMMSALWLEHLDNEGTEQ